MNETKYKVKNMCPYDIGIFLQNGQAPVIKAGSFMLMTADDIMYVDSICVGTRVFERRMLVPFDNTGKEVPLDQLGMWVDDSVPKHNTDEEIEKTLKGNVKKIEAWIEPITDPAELYNICAVAMKLDLPQSKIAILKKANPGFDWDPEV